VWIASALRRGHVGAGELILGARICGLNVEAIIRGGH
jgi:hypothetical protein